MKFARMLVVVTLLTTAAQVANAQSRSPAGEEQIVRDKIRVAVQEICPSSGNKLGSHGTPIKVKVGEETIFLCCQGCLKSKINPQHWATIHANFAKAQRICPIMKKELPQNPKWTLVEGQIVYVCCPPCTEKIAADPQTHLRKIDELYLASLRARQDRR